ncbi:MAG: hypothetical protein ABFR32_07645 [Bacteroidota bacterium]
MKKSIITFIIILIIIAGLWIFIPTQIFDKNDFLHSSFVLVLIIVLGLWVLYKRFISFKNGEPAEDELSKLVLQKSVSLSYYISLYLWLIVSYFSNRLNFETDQLIGYGIIGMAFIFVGSWAYFSLKGVDPKNL